MTSRATETNGRYVSTGHLPSPRQVQAAVDEAYGKYRQETSGENSQTYPALAASFRLLPSDPRGRGQRDLPGAGT